MWPSKEQVIAALEAAEGNVSRAARRLEIGRNVLYRLIEEYGIKRESMTPLPVLGANRLVDR